MDGIVALSTDSKFRPRECIIDEHGVYKIDGFRSVE